MARPKRPKGTNPMKRYALGAVIATTAFGAFTASAHAWPHLSAGEATREAKQRLYDDGAAYVELRRSDCVRYGAARIGCLYYVEYDDGLWCDGEMLVRETATRYVTRGRFVHCSH
jgi:hypothetical protein